MNARERVRRVLNHQIPDRVPNGLGGCETEGLHVIAYDKLQKNAGESGSGRTAGKDRYLYDQCGF